MDRNEDLPSSLHHPSTYQALVDDMLKIQMNRVKVPVKTSGGGEGGGRAVEKIYDLDVTSDKFFELHAGSLFPDAIDANEEEMKLVTKKEEQIRARVRDCVCLVGHEMIRSRCHRRTILLALRVVDWGQ